MPRASPFIKVYIQTYSIRNSLTGKVIDGRIVSSSVTSRVKSAVEKLKEDEIIHPCLATVLVGNDPASSTYVNSKQRAASDVGIITRDHKLESTISQKELMDLVILLNSDPDIHGILIQLPLPDHINEFTVMNTISPLKDVDGLTPTNAGMLLSGKAVLKPCTPLGIMELFDYYNIKVESIDAVIVNRSNLVGKPLAILLLERNATVMMCHSKSTNLVDKLKSAELVVTAVGNRERFTLKNNMVKDGAIVIDVGTSRHSGRVAGDVEDFQSMKEKVSWITPVPGGVGPMTIAMLLNNTVVAASLSKSPIK
ncbi:MAG TPA: bifunctional 5,10-methylenetetrahydrofolate dehydrogenase/5,10-methenyltetrahydrofolate cyclohydrolase [Nitrososphaeraceae archaeon]|nr:bifunctional 5,10-methylenetetrahydrofolate dehydrogenase/5,10-methenyltetrahydrofolate cyclohydrolase [Nitrososphaeraceae archaeon]